MDCIDDMTRDKDLTFQMRVSEEFLRQIDAWRGARFPVLSRAAAIRVLVAQALRFPEDAPQKGKKR